MPKKTVKMLGALCLAISTAAIVGCASNIDHIPTTTVVAPQSMTFNAPFDRVWSAAQAALSADATFKVLDKSSAIMVTEYKTVDSKELSLVGTYFLGKTYKSNYTLNFQSHGAKQAEVRVNVGLQAQQMVLLNREEDQPQVKGYLRQKLYDQIAANLRR